jgi:hypothetical protein
MSELQFPLQFSAQPRARTTDPESSHLAAREVKESGRLGKQQHDVLEAVCQWPGRTSAELAAKLAPDNWFSLRHMVARRLPELEPIHVRKGALRECSKTRRAAVTWFPVEHLARCA